MKAYKDELSALKFSQEQKREMTDFLVEQSRNVQKVHPIRMHRIACIVTAAAVCLTITAFALPSSPVRKMVSEAFAGIIGGDASIQNALGASIGNSAVSNGIMITADAVIGDKNNICIVYSLSREDGKPIEYDIKTLYFSREDHSMVAHDDGVHGYSYFTDTDTNDNTIQYVYAVSVEGLKDSLCGKTINVKFQDLLELTEDGTVPLVKGTWKLKVPLDYIDETRQVAVEDPVMLNGRSFHITELSLSPIGFQLSLLSDDPLPYDPDSNEPVASSRTGGGVALVGDGTEAPASGQDARTAYYEALDAELILADGSIIDLSDMGGSMHNDDDGDLIITRSGTFQEILPKESMQSIRIGEQVIDLS